MVCAMLFCTDVLQASAALPEQSEGVVDEAAVHLPERREV